MIRVIFARPNSPQRTDDGFDLEAEALEALGVEPLWLSLDAIAEQRIEAALERLQPARGMAVLRSWMLDEHDYEYLYESLADRGVDLVNTSNEYSNAHFLPNYFAAIEAHTAPTRWTEGADLDEAYEVSRELEGSLLIKDYVKSAKEHWDAFFIPRGAGREEFDQICTRFIEHRGVFFAGGLVFRSVLPLAPLPLDRGGRPVFDEYRLFYFAGERIAAAPYYDSDGDARDFSRFDSIADQIDSNFFTIDVARLVGGDWVVIEVGDGGVSSLPSMLDLREFYQRLMR